jgi:hypothetical protein
VWGEGQRGVWGEGGGLVERGTASKGVKGLLVYGLLVYLGCESNTHQGTLGACRLVCGWGDRIVNSPHTLPDTRQNRDQLNWPPRP